MDTVYDREVEKKLQQHYSINEVAKRFDVSPKSVRRWISKGKLKAHKIGGSVRIPQEELVKFIHAMSVLFCSGAIMHGTGSSPLLFYHTKN